MARNWTPTHLSSAKCAMAASTVPGAGAGAEARTKGVAVGIGAGGALAEAIVSGGGARFKR